MYKKIGMLIVVVAAANVSFSQALAIKAPGINGVTVTQLGSTGSAIQSQTVIDMLIDGNAIGAVTYDSNANNYIALSSDAGNTFKMTPYKNPDGANPYSFYFNYNSATPIFLIGTDEGLYKSTDGGATSSKVPLWNMPPNAMDMIAYKDNVLVIPSECGAGYSDYLSQDGGASFTEQSAFLLPPGPAAFGANGTLYIAYAPSDGYLHLLKADSLNPVEVTELVNLPLAGTLNPNAIAGQPYVDEKQGIFYVPMAAGQTGNNFIEKCTFNGSCSSIAIPQTTQSPINSQASEGACKANNSGLIACAFYSGLYVSSDGNTFTNETNAYGGVSPVNIGVMGDSFIVSFRKGSEGSGLYKVQFN